MKELYLALKAILTQELEQIAHINKWNNQLVNLLDEVPFARPAIFIEIEPVQWSPVNKRLKKGTISIVFHIVTDSYDTFADDTDGLEALALTDTITAFLETIYIPKCTPFINENTVLDNDHGNLIENKLTFTTEYTKCVGNSKNYQEVTPDLDITKEIN